MFLEMRIKNMLIDRVEIDYQDMITTDERQEHQERIAGDMYERNISKIRQAMVEPEFSVMVRSCME